MERQIYQCHRSRPRKHNLVAKPSGKKIKIQRKLQDEQNRKLNKHRKQQVLRDKTYTVII